MKLIRGLVIVGLLLAGGGGVMLVVTDSMARDAARVATLPRVEPAGFAHLTSGTVVLLEGRLEAGETPGPRGFMAYHRERFTGRETSGANQGRENWQRIGTMLPAIAVEGGGAAVPLLINGYRLDSWPHTERTDEVPRYVSVREATERYLGFKSGDRVTVEGRVVAESRHPGSIRRIQGAVLFGGDAAAYIESRRRGPKIVTIAGGIVVGVGVLLAIGGLFALRAARRGTPGTASQRRGR